MSEMKAVKGIDMFREKYSFKSGCWNDYYRQWSFYSILVYKLTITCQGIKYEYLSYTIEISLNQSISD